MELAFTITEWIFFLSIVASFIVSLKHREKKDLFPIQLYIIFSLATDVILEALEIQPKNISTPEITNIVSNTYSVLEISILFYFLSGIVRGKMFRILILLFFLIYLSICFFVWTGKHKAFYFIVPQLFGIENLFITITCLFYIYEVLKSDLAINFKSDPQFIVICGLLFYFSLMTPLSFSYFIWVKIAPELNQMVRILNMIFYSLLFFSFTKAFLCPSQELKQL
jgi:hypothetical protein